MPKVSVSELEELTNEDDIPQVILKRRLRKEKKENRLKPTMGRIEEE
jgi:hypothetical protein